MTAVLEFSPSKVKTVTSTIRVSESAASERTYAVFSTGRLPTSHFSLPLKDETPTRASGGVPTPEPSGIPSTSSGHLDFSGSGSTYLYFSAALQAALQEATAMAVSAVPATDAVARLEDNLAVWRQAFQSPPPAEQVLLPVLQQLTLAGDLLAFRIGDVTSEGVEVFGQVPAEDLDAYLKVRKAVREGLAGTSLRVELNLDTDALSL